MPPVALFLLHAAIVIGLPYGVWRLKAVRHWIPLVVVQIALGLALGPSLLGRVAPEAWALLFPPPSLAALDGLVWLGITFFAFATGLHFDLGEIAGRGRAFAVTAASAFIAPSLAGAALGVVLLARLPEAAGPGTAPWVFAAGIGIATGVTALPVLAALLREMHMLKSPLGTEAVGCAVIADAALWLAMAVLLALAEGGGPGHAGLMLLAVAAYGLALWLGVRPWLAALFRHALVHGRVNERDVVVLSVGLFASALATEAIGLHAMVGAFAFGAVVPKAVARDLLAKFEPFLMVVLLPFFFIATGLKADFDLASGAGRVFVLASLVSVAAKLAATALPARAFGRPWREALGLGALVGCKGLMELVVLTVLLERGILSSVGFAGMVLMALATTALARPLARLFLGR